MIATLLVGCLALLLVLALGGLVTLGITRRIVREVETALPAQGRFVELSQARLHVLERGPAVDPGLPALLMIHGLAGQLGHFSYRLVDELARTHRVIAIDRPGSGYSSWRSTIEPTLEAQADTVAELIERLALGPVVLVGHSLGGAVALATALCHRDRVTGLALLAPLTQRPKGVPKVFRGLLIGTERLRRLLAWTLVVPIGRLQRDRLLRPIFAPDPLPADYGLQAGGALSLRPGHFLAAARDLAALPASLERMIERYPELASRRVGPIGVLYGRQDRILAADLHGEGFAGQVPGVHLELIDAGHMLPIVAPDACASLIRQVAAQAQREPPATRQRIAQ